MIRIRSGTTALTIDKENRYIEPVYFSNGAQPVVRGKTRNLILMLALNLLFAVKEKI